MLKLSGAAGARLYSFDLPPGKHRVGRVQEVPICIPDPTVSRSHAEIEVDSESHRCFLTDLGSHNGTHVNGERVTDKREIHAGDVIQFGKTEFTITGAGEGTPGPKTVVRTILSPHAPSTSVMLPIKEALAALPKKVTELPALVPAMADMARMLVATEPQETMLEKSLELVSRVVTSDRLLVIFVDGDAARVVASRFSSAKGDGELTLSRTIVHEIMTNKNSVLISHPESDPRFLKQESIVMSAMKSAMAVPLFDEGKVLGILYADTTNPRLRYDQDHLRVLATFGHIIASRLSNYQLLAEREAKLEMQAELEGAAAIQKSLLVSEPPVLERYDVCLFQEQSRSVGGDLYDVKKLKDGRFFLVVADVSGKGMGAALLMSNILACFRVMYEDTDFTLATVVSRVSAQLFSYSAPGQFATLFCGLLEPDSGSFRYVNAGHNPPMVMKATGSVDLLGSTGLMIGAFDFAQWEEGQCRIEPGEYLVAYSDGVTELQTATHEEFGEARLEAVLKAHSKSTSTAMVAELRKEMATFAAGAPALDDITLLVLRRHPA